VNTLLAAGYLLWAYQRIFLTHHPQGAGSLLTDLRYRELIMAGLLCTVMIGVGLYADPWIQTINKAIDATAYRLEAVAGTDHPVPH